MFFRFAITFGLLIVTPLRAEEFRADVIVYGATPAGVCAAVGASREGADVILVEPTGHVGGMNTGGLSFSDSNQTVRSAMGGLFAEFHERIEADYQSRGVALPYNTQTKDHTHWTYEPNVAMRVTQAMLTEAKVRVLTKRPLAEVRKNGIAIGSFSTTSGDTFTGKVFVDATYEGDLMAKVATWVIGREGRAEFGESFAGRQYSKPAIPVSGLDAQGKLLPLLTDAEAGADDVGDKNVMVYSFRLCLTESPNNRVPFPLPTNYKPERFEIIRRYFKQAKRSGLLLDLYPLPGDKFDANNGIYKQFSLGLVGGGNEWCEADQDGRRKIWEVHRQYTLELYHFLTTDLSVPVPLRERLARLGLCKDEFAASDNWPPQLYVREGRRMRGAYVLTQADILTRRTKSDSIAVCSFPIDSHDCRRIALDTTRIVNEGTIFPVRIVKGKHGPAYQVPYKSITPLASECSNLLVPTALSASHVAFSSIRVEPSWMNIGHSAGIAAALAASRDSMVQNLPYALLKDRLVAQKQIIDHPATAE